MKLRYFGVAAVGFWVSACGLGDNADIGNETNQKIDADGGGATSMGGATQGAGGSTHATGGSTHATGGATAMGGATMATGGATAMGGATTATGGSTAMGGATMATGGTGNGPQCGSKVCPSGQVCCNASCGVCTPPGYACDAIACVPDPVDAGPPTTGASCSTTADCHLLSDYCGGCNCLALGKGQKAPVCASTPVSCLLDPCSMKTVACVNNRCVAQ
ncbi:MAG TPA: hypothetical protein VH062_21945 [Polyangiaceae bacterium]|jgi:hypothetical protein|nr:hypothetical protein [Polyangiaceae bacterium]